MSVLKLSTLYSQNRDTVVIRGCFILQRLRESGADDSSDDGKDPGTVGDGANHVDHEPDVLQGVEHTVAVGLDSSGDVTELQVVGALLGVVPTLRITEVIDVGDEGLEGPDIGVELIRLRGKNSFNREAHCLLLF